MSRYIITLDLGTTNVKVGVYDSELKEVFIYAESVNYLNHNNRIEFDPENYWNLCEKCIERALQETAIDPKNVLAISLTGQAESLILLDRGLNPLRNGISWMDNRTIEECKILKTKFEINECYYITGLPDIIPTWPITKILWIKRNEKEIFQKVYKYLLLKDYIIFKLTGRFLSEYTIYNFSCYLDIERKQYWTPILDYAGVKPEQLPALIEPGEIAGTVTEDIGKRFHFTSNVYICVGTLDHFAGMIGTGNVKEGILSETTGTVLALATMVKRPLMNKYHIPCHYNAIKNTYALLPVCESGGISLEWFKNTFFANKSYAYLNDEISKTMDSENEIIFLPYITGTNSPEYNPNAKGVFFGIRMHHNKINFARAVMEGVAFLLNKNIELIEKLDIKVEQIISLGGGSKSEVWNQIKADVTGKNILIPGYEEATSLGAAILAAVKCGIFKNVNEAIEKNVQVKKVYAPRENNLYRNGYRKFLSIYEQLTPIFNT